MSEKKKAGIDIPLWSDTTMPDERIIKLVRSPYEVYDWSKLSDASKNMLVTVDPLAYLHTNPDVITVPSLKANYGVIPSATTTTKLTIEEQYSNIQEQLSDLVQSHNQLREELIKVQAEYEARIDSLENENTQLKYDNLLIKNENIELNKKLKKSTQEKDQAIKKLSRTKARKKSYKDELSQKEKFEELSEDVVSLSERMRTLEDEYSFKKDHA